MQVQQAKARTKRVRIPVREKQWCISSREHFLTDEEHAAFIGIHRNTYGTYKEEGFVASTKTILGRIKRAMIKKLPEKID